MVLGTDKFGEAFDEEWSCSAAVRMLLYLSSNTRPDIQFAVHQVAWFSHCPKKSHAQAVKHILLYLKQTETKGTTFTPDLTKGLDCYVDADFAGLWGHEDEQDPVCAKSRTGFTLTFLDVLSSGRASCKLKSLSVALLPSMWPSAWQCVSSFRCECS